MSRDRSSNKKGTTGRDRRIYPAYSSTFARMADGTILKGIDWGRTMAQESRFTDPTEYGQMNEVSLQTLT